MKSNSALILLGLTMLVVMARASMITDVKDCNDMWTICTDDPQPQGPGIYYGDCPKR